MNKNPTNRQAGQSIVLVALLLVALVLFVAVAVDVTKAYADRRTAQNAADAAALAAAQELGHYLRGDPTNDANVLAMLKDFAQRNGGVSVTGRYLDEGGTPVGDIGEGTIPNQARGVEATAFITAPTYFGGIIGLDGLPLNAEAAVQFEGVCQGGECLLPIAVYSAGYQEGSDPNSIVEFDVGQCYNLWDGAGGGNFGWLHWQSQGSQYSCVTNIDSSDCSVPCIDFNMNPATCQQRPQDMVQVNDWVAGKPGVANAEVVRNWLNYYIENEIVARFVVYDRIEVFGTGNTQCPRTDWSQNPPVRKGQYYRVAGFGAFQITGYRLSHGNGEVRFDTPGVNPEDCVDYPNNNGLCCTLWEERVDEDGYSYFECASWGACEYNTGDVNRITGIARLWTDDTAETCDAVGSFLAPKLSR